MLLLVQSTPDGKRSGYSSPPIELEAEQGMAMGTVKIEKIGGLAGFGLPGSRIKSSGETAISALSPADQAWVEALFQKPPRSQEVGNERDTHCYRITRTKNGRDQTIEVPEAVVPHSLKACVTDKLL
jgi:Emfourin